MIAPAPENERFTSLDRVHTITPPSSSGRAFTAQSPVTEQQQKPQPFLQRTIAQYPLIALASAGVVGMALGWLVKRRLR